jgi:hypothetical protein
MYNHHIWHNLKYYICLIKQLCSYLHTLHCLVSIFNQFLCLHHFWRIVLFVTTQIGVRPPKNSPTSPNSPSVHLFALELLSERTPYLRYNSHGQQLHDCRGTRKTLPRPTPGRKAIRPPVQDCLQPQTRLPKIPNRHRRRQCPVTGGTVLFSRLVATLLATANPASTGCHGLALSCCLAGKVRTSPLWTTTTG